MNKQELIGAVAARTGLARGDAAEAVEATFDLIVEALGRGEEVRVVGFGSFAIGTRKPSVGRNPRTGETISIPATTHPKFRPGKLLKELG